MGQTKVQRIIKQLKGNVQKQTPIASEMFLPNHSGDHSAGKTGTPVNNLDLVNKKYVDDSVPTGASGTWTAGSGETITALNGIITFITSAAFFILLETGDFILLETGDKIING